MPDHGWHSSEPAAALVLATATSTTPPAAVLRRWRRPTCFCATTARGEPSVLNATRDRPGYRVAIERLRVQPRQHRRGERDRVEIPKGQTRSPLGACPERAAVDATCRTASKRVRTESRRVAWTTSCGHGTRRALRRLLARRSRTSRLQTNRGQGVQATARSILSRRNERIFPSAFKEAHLLQPAERPIERAVRREQSAIRDIAEVFRNLVPVKLFGPSAEEISGVCADCQFEGNQCSWLATHAAV
jgi:hypothetical protein